MARMIPGFVDDSAPPGEREVFRLIAQGPDDWVVIHSLDLAPWNRGLRTEIDFVVIAPRAGIICVEVKSHDIIRFDGESWYPSSIKKSPFKQATDGKYSFYRRLREIAPTLSRIPVVHCCIFTHAYFDVPPNLSVQPWELIDGREFEKFASGVAFADAMRDRLIRSIEADNSLSKLSDKLSTSTVQQLIDSCLPVQKGRPMAREEILKRQEQTGRILREQQKPVLVLAENNDRLVVTGGAGTGKTLIAMELGRRLAETGMRVGLLCFNALIGAWMKETVMTNRSHLPNLIVGRALQLLAEMADIRIPDQPSKQYWEHELPGEIENRLTDPTFCFSAVFDYLIVDEAQDLMSRTPLWECLTRMLAGGLTHGKFALFGDFDNQVLSSRQPMEQNIESLANFAHPTFWRLSENCRNYRIIGETAAKLGGLTREVYKDYLRPGGSVENYDIFFYEHNPQQIGKIAEWIREFRSAGYKPNEIALLSFRSYEDSAAEKLVHGGWKLQSARARTDYISYSTVHTYKGMENKVIILTDVELDGPEFQRDLFYTGLTRATESVRVCCHKQSGAVISQWLVSEVKHARTL